jgi:diguanylate cyclase (GGDEF)-like protein
MDLDLRTLLYVCIAAAILAAGVLALFGITQGTHPGFRHWTTAQWLLVAGLMLQALFGQHAFMLPVAGLLVLQWPVAVLAGMRLLHLRKPPGVPGALDWIVLALGASLVAAAWASDGGAARNVGALALACFIVNLYAAVLVSRLGDFQHSFALKALAAILGITAVLDAVCGVFASLESAATGSIAGVQLSTMVATVVSALGLVPIALALTYERTVAKMRARHRKLRHLADIDVLTRLPNRRHFHELATRTLATTEPAQAALLMFDIANLKRINDLLGPASGDEALRQVGLALRETLRSRDVAGRLGGDEFAALLPETTVADAVRVSERIIRRLEDRQVAPRTARLTLNVGAVQMRAGDTIIEGLRRAEVALEDARRHHREGTALPAPEAPAEPAVTLDPPVVLDPTGIVLEPKAV